MAFKAEIKGLDSLLKKLDKMPKEIKEEVIEEIHDFGRRVALKAKQRAPKDVSGLAQSIHDTPLPDGTGIVVMKKYAAYIEFGTGRYVFLGEAWITPEIEAYAHQFFVNGKGRLYPQPFLFNSFFEEKKTLIDNLKKILK